MFRDAGYEIVLNPYKRRLSGEEVGSLLTEDVVGMIAGVEPLTEEILTSARGLKAIARCGVGLDSVDLNTAKLLEILVSNTPDAPTLPVAELTLAHMLNLLRRISNTDRQIRSGQWQPQMGSLLSGKKVGIVGFGRIGSKVAELVTAFGAKILAYDPEDISWKSNVTSLPLGSLLSESDIITLHAPYTPKLHHFIGDKQFSLMKKTAYLLNISRGGLVDETALYDALVEGRIAGAGLDTFEQEPYTGPLCELENVTLTAHMGSYAQESRAKQEQEAAVNLVAAFKELKLIK